MTKKLKGKTTVITGGAGAIGKSTAKRFLEEGASVLLVDLKEDDLKSAVDELGGNGVYYAVADVSKADDVKNYAHAARQQFDKVDIFFNNAGIEGVVKPISE